MALLIESYLKEIIQHFYVKEKKEEKHANVIL